MYMYIYITIPKNSYWLHSHLDIYNPKNKTNYIKSPKLTVICTRTREIKTLFFVFVCETWQTYKQKTKPKFSSYSWLVSETVYIF